MKADLDAHGRAILELSATELRTLYLAVDREAAYHTACATDNEIEADSRDEIARSSRKRVKFRRSAGELREKAAGHRAMARDAGDLRRVLYKLTTNENAR